MQLPDRIRKHENLHIVFWLIKDSCWMLEIKWLGALMIGPALFMAIRITYITRNTLDFFINLAILFWISANSYWMISEFYFDNEGKNLAGIPFGLGFVAVGIFYYKVFIARRKAGEPL
jgi:hypothetical protein